MGTLQGLCPLLLCISSISEAAGREGKLGVICSFREKRRTIRIWKLKVADPPSQPSSSSNSSFFVMKQPLHTWGEHHGPEMPGIQRCASPLQNHLGPIPNPLLSSQHQKDCIITVWCKPHLQYLGLLLYCHQFTDTRHCGSTYQEAGTVGKLPFSLEFNARKDFLLSPLAFLLFFASLQNHVNARHNNQSLSSTCRSNFSFQFFSCLKF